MSRRPAGERVRGPYRERKRWRVRVFDDGGGCRDLVYETKAEASAAVARLRAELASVAARTVGEAIEAYGEAMGEEIKAVTVAQNLYRLRAFFAGREDVALRRLTREACEDAYEALRTGEGERGKRLAVDSQRAMLGAAKTFLRWCVRQGWIAASPAESIKGVGRRRRGKAQLRLDEARRWDATALALAPRDPGALAALLALYLSLRASEIVGLRCRDVDDGGRLVWVADSKTEAGRRTVEVPRRPAALRRLLLDLAGDRPGDELLFGPHWRDWPREQVQRICEIAGVPKITAHGLRGQHASLAVAAGQTAEAVARTLGHADDRVTVDHYAGRSVVEAARRERGIKVLRGKR
jgi:integrase